MSDVTRYRLRVEGKHEKTCPACGVAFKGQAVTVYCSHTCKIRNRAKREAAQPERFYELPKDYQRPSRQVCRVTYPACRECAMVFCAHRGTSRMWCSDECRDVAEKRLNRERYLVDLEANRAKAREYSRSAYHLRPSARQAFMHVGECGWCKRQFTGHGNAVYCSKDCANKANPHPSGTWNHRHLQRVAERDGWICHLCGKAVRPGQESVDHLIPVSAGGQDAMINVALAHVVCNSRRGARGKAQLRLLG